MTSDRDQPLRDPHTDDAAEVEALLAQYVALGGRAEDLSGEVDLVAATSILAMLPPGPRRPFPEAVAAAGLDADVARRIWSGLGMEADEQGLTDDEASILGVMAASLELVGETRLVELSRVIGLSARHLAEAIASSVRVGFEVPAHRRQTGRVELAERYFEMIEASLPAVMSVVDPVLRRQLADVALRRWRPDGSESVATREATIGFADLVGFTDWTATASMGELGEALDAFDSVVWTAAGESGIEIVKLIGDEVMFAASEADQALAGARDIVGQTAAHGAIKAVRVGLATGEVVSRAGDLFGMVVNQASRLVRVADPGRILVTVETADQASGRAFGELIEIEARGFTGPISACYLIEPAQV